MNKDYQFLYRSTTLSDYVRVYDDALSSEQCQSLIESFDVATDQQAELVTDVHSFVHINMNQHDWYMDDLYNSITLHRQRYWDDCNISLQQIGQHDYEAFKIRRFSAAAGHRQQPYVDAYNRTTSQRFLTCIWNLNDVEQGGETTFFRLEEPLSIAPRRGQLIMFPASWQYVRAELPPLSEDRYSVVSYFHWTGL